MYDKILQQRQCLYTKFKLNNKKEDKKMHDYGLNDNERLIENNHWKLIPYKRVVLANVRTCKNRITVNKIATKLRDWKVPQLERTEAVWLTEAIVEAINRNQQTADISKMFNIQVAIYTDHGYAGTLPREAISAMLFEKLFTKTDENDEQITVKLKWWCLL